MLTLIIEQNVFAIINCIRRTADILPPGCYEQIELIIFTASSVYCASNCSTLVYEYYRLSHIHTKLIFWSSKFCAEAVNKKSGQSKFFLDFHKKNSPILYRKHDFLNLGFTVVSTNYSAMTFMQQLISTFVYFL